MQSRILPMDESILEDSSNCQYLLIVSVRYDDTGLGGRCVNDLSVTDIQCYMTGVADQVSGLCIGKSVNCGALAAVCGRGMRQAYTEVRIHAHYKSGAVRTVGQTGSSIYIRVTNEL